MRMSLQRFRANLLSFRDNVGVNPIYRNNLFACILLGFVATAHAGAQAVATASRTITPSAFVMGSGVFTGLNAGGGSTWKGGKNLSVTAGVDVGVYSFSRYVVGVEVRGTYPVHEGKIVGEKNVLGGVRLAREPQGNGRLRPYLDALFGRGEMDYQSGGVVTSNLLYTKTAGNVFAGGAGVELDLTQHFTAKLDGQLENWSTPVTASGSVHSTAFSIGVAYRFGAGDGPR